MLVKHVGLQVLDVLVGELPAVQGLDLVLHDVAVLLDVVLLVELVAQRHNVLVRDIGVGVELGTRSGVGSLDIVLDKIPFLAEVGSAVEGLDILQGDLLVDGHEGIHHLTADFLAGHLVIDKEIVHDRDHHVLGDGLARMHVGKANAVHKLLTVKLFEASIGLTYFHITKLFVTRKGLKGTDCPADNPSHSSAKLNCSTWKTGRGREKLSTNFLTAS